MQQPRTIMVATDFGEPAEAALDFALSLAPKLDAEVVLVHAYETPGYAYPGAPLPIVDVAPQIARAAQAGLDAAVERARKRWPRIRGVLRKGKAWREIVSTAEELDPRMVVVGTHDRRGLERAVLGSVAAKIVRTSHVPVVTIHAR